MDYSKQIIKRKKQLILVQGFFNTCTTIEELMECIDLEVTISQEIKDLKKLQKYLFSLN